MACHKAYKKKKNVLLCVLCVEYFFVQREGNSVMRESVNGTQEPFRPTSSQRLTPGWKLLAAATGAVWIAGIIAVSPSIQSRLLQVLASMAGQ